MAEEAPVEAGTEEAEKPTSCKKEEIQKKAEAVPILKVKPKAPNK